MSQINSPPVGLQSLLGSKNFGVNPSELLQEVRAGVDLFPFWATQFLQTQQVSALAVAGAGSVIEIQVPGGENWWPLSVGFSAEVIAANEDTSLTVALDQTLAGTSFFVVAENGADNLQLGRGSFRVVWAPAQGFLLPSSTVIRGVIASSSAVARDYLLDIVYYRLTV